MYMTIDQGEMTRHSKTDPPPRKTALQLQAADWPGPLMNDVFFGLPRTCSEVMPLGWHTMEVRTSDNTG